MRKIGGIWLIILCMSLVSCMTEGKKKEIELLDVDKSFFCYEETEQVDQIAVDEEGFLYTTEYIRTEKSEEIQGSVLHAERVCTYDLDGNCVETVELQIGSGDANVLFYDEGKLYFIIMKASTGNPTLYEVDVVTWETKELYGYSGYKSISDAVKVDDYIYVLGRLKYSEAKEYILHPDVVQYQYEGEAISRINIATETMKEELLKVDFPISIFRTSEGLGIYSYTEKNGFVIMELSQQKGTLTECCVKNTVTPSQGFISCESGYLFYNLNGGCLYYGTLDGTEADISETSIRLLKYQEPAYIKGFAFYINAKENCRVERICVGEILQDNREIHILMHTYTQDIPFGCGYQMIKHTLEPENFSLKVLAQDRDFDVYVLSSRENISHNLKKNGAFYPLNEVKGVKEYLDTCFPYLKELATDEEGNIWMVPVALAIPGLNYNKEYCLENEVNLEEMDFEEFLVFTQETEKTSPRLTSISYMVAMESFFGQYFQTEESFDTELFRTYAQLFRDGLGIEGATWILSEADIDNEMYYASQGKMEWPKFYYETSVYQKGILTTANQLGKSSPIGAIGIPTLSEETKNQGTLTLLAVNPQSDNLKETLNYISAFAKYMMTKQDSFVLKDEALYSEHPYIKEWYQIYADGDVRFDMDSEVYEELFLNYLRGDLELEEMIIEAERRRKIYIGE